MDHSISTLGSRLMKSTVQRIKAELKEIYNVDVSSDNVDVVVDLYDRLAYRG